MDGDGIPIALDITPGNTNEQVTLKPLEEKIIKDFNTSKFVVCTDAGLASTTNRKFNNTNDRRFITTQSIKQLKSFLKEWALDLTSGWKLYDSDKTYNITNNINISGTKKIMGNGATITTNVIPNIETNTNLIYAFTITNGYNVVIDNFNFTKVFTGIRTINNVKYYLTSCDLIGNELIEIK